MTQFKIWVVTSANLLARKHYVLHDNGGRIKASAIFLPEYVFLHQIYDKYRFMKKQNGLKINLEKAKGDKP